MSHLSPSVPGPNLHGATGVTLGKPLQCQIKKNHILKIGHS